jgi:hypothetical protein
MQTISKLQLINNQNQLIKKNLENLENNVKPLNQVGDNFKEIKSILGIQTRKIQAVLGWKIVFQIALVVIPAMLGLFISLYLLAVQNNSILEKKINQINTRNEQIWKKIK